MSAGPRNDSVAGWPAQDQTLRGFISSPSRGGGFQRARSDSVERLGFCKARGSQFSPSCLTKEGCAGWRLEHTLSNSSVAVALAGVPGSIIGGTADNSPLNFKTPRNKLPEGPLVITTPYNREHHVAH